MSTEPARRLADWIRALVDACDLDPAGGGARLRSVVGTRRARIGLDDEVVEVALRGVRFEIVPPQGSLPVDGAGSTTTATVLALLDARLEVTEAFRSGAIELTGHRQAAVRILTAIEILIDASTRVPTLRGLADEFRDGAPRSMVVPPRDDDRVTEHELLDRLGLLGVR